MSAHAGLDVLRRKPACWHTYEAEDPIPDQIVVVAQLIGAPGIFSSIFRAAVMGGLVVFSVTLCGGKLF
ncbi:hypothetical protein [Chromobacterium haemolyticum]|uniref:hypothetical protein n=1 Tax=Chromobacterium haemolyticum TaxID=394935 RepID=UPI0011323990|nr:hypothetical protein [Chromobacterium haemolyticum]